MEAKERTPVRGMTEAAARAYIAALTYGEKVQLLALLKRMEDRADLQNLQESRRALDSREVGA